MKVAGGLGRPGRRGAVLGVARGVGDREQEVAELNSKAPVRDERKKAERVRSKQSCGSGSRPCATERKIADRQ